MGEMRGRDHIDDLFAKAEAAETCEETAEESRERHERVVGRVLETLRGEGYFHDGESATLVFPPEGKESKWAVRVDVKALFDPPTSAEYKTKFPSSDTLLDRLVAEGYSVDVHPGDMDDVSMTAEYRLSKKTE
jgi:hypothetical protein